MLPPGTELQSANQYVNDGSISVAETPELFKVLDENILNQHIRLNPAEPVQPTFLQPSLWHVPECTESGFWSQHTDVRVLFFQFQKLH